MNTKKLIIIGVSSYLFFLLILLPAATIISFVNLPKNTVSLTGVKGSLWSGTIDKIVFNKNTLETTNWSLKPVSLLMGSVSADIDTSFKGLPVSTDLDYSLLSKAIVLQNLKSSIDASKIPELLNLPFGQLSGDIRIALSDISIDPNQVPMINGNVLWNKAKLALSSTMSLGQINIKLDSNVDSGLTALISNKQGELSINGDLKVLANKSYTLNIRLKPRANASTELRSLLSLIAPKKDKSEHIILRQGHLRDLGIRL